MDRRSVLKQVAAAAAMGAVAPQANPEQPDVRSYDSATISVRLMEEQKGITSVVLTEHGDADQVIVEAFYWTTVEGHRLLLHRETTAPLVKGVAVGASLPMPVTSIAFLRVKEMKLLTQSEFGKVPHEPA
jgi:hypothetical protein